MGMVTIDAKKVAWKVNREGHSADFLIPHDEKRKTSRLASHEPRHKPFISAPAWLYCSVIWWWSEW
jgi:hypothetical protein